MGNKQHSGQIAYFNPLNATGANMHQVAMLTDNSGIERVKAHNVHVFMFYYLIVF